MTIGELATAEKVQPPSMTRTVNALCAKGLITRAAQATDKRLVVVGLNDAARALVLAHATPVAPAGSLPTSPREGTS